MGYHRPVRLSFLPVLASLALAACGGYPSGGPQPGQDRACRDDRDCAGDRLCVEGVCLDPGGEGGGDGGGGGGGDCIEATAACACEGNGFAGGITELRFFSCDEARSLSIEGDLVVIADVERICTAEVLACEREGLARLLDQAFTGCAPDVAACQADGGNAWFACREEDGLCIAFPADGSRCGEGALQTAISQIRDRALREGSCEEGKPPG